jgi:HJR/Mrr/RecB family endonuclease
VASLIDIAGLRYAIRPDRFTTVGRDPDNDIVLENASVSRRHASIVTTVDGYHIRDLDSSNGTFVSAQRIADAILSDGERIQFGNVSLTFHLEQSNALPVPTRFCAGCGRSVPAETSYCAHCGAPSQAGSKSHGTPESERSYFRNILLLLYISLTGTLVASIAFYTHRYPASGFLIVGVCLLLASLVYLRVRQRWRESLFRKRLLLEALERERLDRLGQLEFDKIDRMDGTAFELHMLEVFRDQGYEAKHVGEHGDQGCDLLLSKNGVTIVCQCKRYRPGNLVRSPEVRKSLGGIWHWGAQRVIFVTTSDFTREARELEHTAPCELIEREGLRRMIASVREKQQGMIAALRRQTEEQEDEEEQRGHGGAAWAAGTFTASLILGNLLVGVDLRAFEARLFPEPINQTAPAEYKAGKHLTHRAVRSIPEPVSINNETAHVSIPMRPCDARYELVEDSPVFRDISDSASVLATVHRGKTLHVIGTGGAFLQIRMKNGRIGFVPRAVAEYRAEWLNDEALNEQTPETSMRHMDELEQQEKQSERRLEAHRKWAVCKQNFNVFLLSPFSGLSCGPEP